MKLLWIILHIGAFFAGLYDNGDMTFLGMLLIFDAVILWDKLSEGKKRRERR